MPVYFRLTKRFTPILLAIGIPASLKHIAEYLQQVIDTMYIGQYSSQSLVAISSVMMPVLIIESIWIGFSVAVTILISQYIGAKDPENSVKVAQSAFVLGLIFALGYLTFWQTSAPLVFKLMNLTGDTAKEASIYVQTLSLNYVLRYLGNHAPTSILLAQGKTRILMWATLLQSLTNIALNPIFIWGIDGLIPEMGLRGAAIGTLCGEFLAIGMISHYFWSHDTLNLKKKKLFPLKFYIRDRIRIGMPITLEIMMWSFASAVIISMMNNVFDKGGAIFNIAYLLSDLSYRALYGFDIANTTLIGQGFGAKRKDRMIAVLRASFRTKVICGLTLVTILYLFQKQFVTLFTNDPTIIATVLDNYIWILAVSLTVMTVGLNMSTLNGMGYSRYCLYISLICIPLRVLLSWFVIFHTDWGFGGVWAATLVEEIIRLIATYWSRQIMVRRYWNKWELT